MCEKCEELGINDDPEGRGGLKPLKEGFHDAPLEPSIIQKVIRFIILPWTPFFNPLLDKVALWGFKRTMINMMEGKVPKSLAFEYTSKNGKNIPVAGGFIDLTGKLPPLPPMPGSRHTHTEEEEEDTPIPPQRPTRKPQGRQNQLDFLNNCWNQD